jgi:prephenate dehydrogenase
MPGDCTGSRPEHVITVAIAGVGLIGGSFARALQQTGFTGRIVGVSSERTTREALALGVIHEAVTLDEAAARADLLFLAQPILHLIDDLAKLQGKLKPGALVTDGGSTKALVCEAGRALGHQFIGGHPMAGKEARGVQYATGDLFRGCNWVLTPQDPEHLNQPMAQWLQDRIRAFGARLVILAPETHDRVVASTSHLVQLLSTSLAVTLAEVPEAPGVVGPAGIEMTRVAMSDFGMWSDIFATNAVPVRDALDQFILHLQQIRNSLTDPELQQTFDKAAASAKRLRSPNVKNLA